MTIVLHRIFRKQFQKLRASEQKKFKERRDIFLKDPFDPVLNNHALKGKHERYRSIAIGGDLRALYRELPGEVYIFTEIGTHHTLYGS